MCPKNRMVDLWNKKNITKIKKKKKEKIANLLYISVMNDTY